MMVHWQSLLITVFKFQKVPSCSSGKKIIRLYSGFVDDLLMVSGAGLQNTNLTCFRSECWVSQKTDWVTVYKFRFATRLRYKLIAQLIALTAHLEAIGRLSSVKSLIRIHQPLLRITLSKHPLHSGACVYTALLTQQQQHSISQPPLLQIR